MPLNKKTTPIRDGFLTLKKYYKGKQHYVVLSNDSSVQISVRPKEEFLKHLI